MRRILWIYNINVDVDSNITTWREMHRNLKDKACIHFIFSYEHDPHGFSRHITSIKPLIKIPYLKKITFIIMAFMHYLKILGTFKPDICIVDTYTFFFTIFFRTPGLRSIMDLRTHFYNSWSNDTGWLDILIKLWTKIALICNRRFHRGISYISNTLRLTLEKDLKVKLNENYFIWPSGVDTSVFDPDKYIKNRSRGKFNIIFHGELSFNRGLIELLDAVEIVAKEIDIECNLLGEGESSQFLRNYVEQRGLNTHVKLHGNKPYKDIPYFIHNADVAVMAYPMLKYWEVNVPLKILEYLAMKKVIILSELKLFREIVAGTDCGIFIKDNKPATIANAIKYAFENRDKLSAWGARGRELALSKYQWKNIALNFAENLEKIAAS